MNISMISNKVTNFFHIIIISLKHEISFYSWNSDSLLRLFVYQFARETKYENNF